MPPHLVSDTSPEFLALIRKARDGDQHALGKLLNSFRIILKRRGMAMIRRDPHPQFGDSDLVQETMLKAVRKFDHFDGDSPEQLNAWLIRLLKNNFLDMDRAFRGTDKRSVALEKPLAEMDNADRDKALAAPFEAPDICLDAQEDGQTIARAVERLPERYRLVIRQRLWEKASFESIARMIGISTEAARKRYTRGLAELRDLLNGASTTGPAG